MQFFKLNFICDIWQIIPNSRLLALLQLPPFLHNRLSVGYPSTDQPSLYAFFLSFFLMLFNQSSQRVRKVWLKQKIIATGKSSTLQGWPSSGRVIHPYPFTSQTHSATPSPHPFCPKQPPEDSTYVTRTRSDGREGCKRSPHAQRAKLKRHGPVWKPTNGLIIRFCLFQIESLKIYLFQSRSHLLHSMKSRDTESFITSFLHTFVDWIFLNLCISSQLSANKCIDILISLPVFFYQIKWVFLSN